MKPSATRIFTLIVTCLVTLNCCSDDADNRTQAQLLLGKWNLEENDDGTTCHCLTIAYDDGLDFSSGGKFALRKHYTVGSTGWTEDGSVGDYVLEADSIRLIYFPGTADEIQLRVKILKLDEHHLWIRHNYYKAEGSEYHLERAMN